MVTRSCGGHLVVYHGQRSRRVGGGVNRFAVFFRVQVSVQPAHLLRRAARAPHGLPRPRQAAGAAGDRPPVARRNRERQQRPPLCRCVAGRAVVPSPASRSATSGALPSRGAAALAAAAAARTAPPSTRSSRRRFVQPRGRRDALDGARIRRRSRSSERTGKTRQASRARARPRARPRPDRRHKHPKKRALLRDHARSGSETLAVAGATPQFRLLRRGRAPRRRRRHGTALFLAAAVVLTWNPPLASAESRNATMDTRPSTRRRPRPRGCRRCQRRSRTTRRRSRRRSQGGAGWQRRRHEPRRCSSAADRRRQDGYAGQHRADALEY